MARKKGLADHMDGAPSHMHNHTGHSFAPTIWGKTQAFADMLDESDNLGQRLAWAKQIAPDGGYDTGGPYADEALALLSAAYSKNGLGGASRDGTNGSYRSDRKTIRLAPDVVAGEDAVMSPAWVLAHELGHAWDDQSAGGFGEWQSRLADGDAKEILSVHDRIFAPLYDTGSEWYRDPAEKFANMAALYVRDPEFLQEMSQRAYEALSQLMANDYGNVFARSKAPPRGTYRDVITGKPVTQDQMRNIQYWKTRDAMKK